MKQRIQFAVDTETDLVVSRKGNKLAWPILQYEAMTPANGFRTSYKLESIDLFTLPELTWRELKWTRSIPAEIKQKHVAFWNE